MNTLAAIILESVVWSTSGINSYVNLELTDMCPGYTLRFINEESHNGSNTFMLYGFEFVMIYGADHRHAESVSPRAGQGVQMFSVSGTPIDSLLVLDGFEGVACISIPIG